MITDEQITALAREYAEETVSMRHTTGIVADEAEGVIRWLLHRYALVEKSKVQETWEEITDVYLAHRHITYDGARYLFNEVLFPEIAKEVQP